MYVYRDRLDGEYSQTAVDKCLPIRNSGRADDWRLSEPLAGDAASGWSPNETSFECQNEVSTNGSLIEPLLDLRGRDEESDGCLHDEVAHEARARLLARLHAGSTRQVSTLSEVRWCKPTQGWAVDPEEPTLYFAAQRNLLMA